MNLEFVRQIDELFRQPGRIWMMFAHCYGSECQQIIDHSTSLRQTTQVATDTGVLLYLADDAVANNR